MSEDENVRIIRSYYRELVETAGGHFYSSSPTYLSGRWDAQDTSTAVFVDMPLRADCNSIRIYLRGSGCLALLTQVLAQLEKAYRETDKPDPRIFKEFQKTVGKGMEDWFSRPVISPATQIPIKS